MLTIIEWAAAGSNAPIVVCHNDWKAIHEFLKCLQENTEVCFWDYRPLEFLEKVDNSIAAIQLDGTDCASYWSITDTFENSVSIYDFVEFKPDYSGFEELLLGE